MATTHAQQMGQLHAQITELRNQLNALQKEAAAKPVDDYQFDTLNGKTSLCALFEDKDDLIVIHNMGTSCPYCMLWTDGFNGVADHLKNRAAIAISSPDTPEVQETFRASRNWKFPMVSLGDNSFASDMGYQIDDNYMPGVSVFKREADGIKRVSTSPFGPGDDYCSLWHLLDLLPGGAKDWQPRFTYSD